MSSFEVPFVLTNDGLSVSSGNRHGFRDAFERGDLPLSDLNRAVAVEFGPRFEEETLTIRGAKYAVVYGGLLVVRTA